MAPQRIVPFLTFDNQAEEAVNLYVSAFPNSRITSATRYGDGGPGSKGSVMSIAFELDGQEFMALNGGPTFKFAEGISLFVNCETQAEVDRLWEKLSEGGDGGRCGWLKDRFGVSWQIIPAALGRMLGDRDQRKAQNVMHAMLQMKKLDIEALRQAYERA